MKKHVLLFLFLLSSLAAVAQKTTLSYQVVVYVEQKTADHFGGRLAMQDSVNAQLAKVNARFNAEAGLNNFYNFTAYSFKFYNDNANDDSTFFYHQQNPEPNNRYRLVYNAFPQKQVNSNYVNAYTIVFEIGFQSVLFSYRESVSANGSMFGRVMNNTIAHEFMHSRGAWDLYAGDLEASENTVNNTKGWRNPTPSLMNSLFTATNLDKHSLYMINRTATLYGASTFDDGQRASITANAYPANVSIKVLNSSGGNQSNATVRLYGIEWYSHTLSTTPLTYTTDASGNVNFSGLGANPFNQGGFPKYNTFFVTVTSGTTVKYAWLNCFEVSHAFIDGLTSFTKTISLGSANIAPQVSIGNSGNLINYNTNDFSIPVFAYDLNGTISTVKIYDNGVFFADAQFDGSNIYWMLHYPNLSVGKHLFTAVATDNNGASTTSGVLQVDDLPLHVINTAITAPLTGSTYSAPGAVVFNAYAVEGGGGISKVEYYNGANLIGMSTTKPYAFTWNNVAAGTYSITAKAYNTQSTPLIKTSAAISITVNTVLSPVVSITSPMNNSTFTIPATITITANASETGGSISKVEFYRGTTLLGTDFSSPYSYTWTNATAGNYVLTAKAYDAQATPATKTSAAVNITVNPALSPVVSITSPANNATFSAPATVTITANASETGGSISKVEFYRGTTLLGTDFSSPYSYTWTNVAAGTYALTAKAYDAQTTPATTTSAVVNITVNAGGTCTAQQWNSTTAYSGGAIVQYAGIRYIANWWNQNRRPDLYNGPAGSGQDWTSQGTCNSRMGALESNTTIAAYPNPTNGEVTFQVGNAEGEASLDIYTAQGIKVANVFSGELSEKEISFHTSSLAKGLYIVLFTNQQTSTSLTLVVE